MSKIHKGLGKSFNKMFGQDKVRGEILDEQNETSSSAVSDIKDLDETEVKVETKTESEKEPIAKKRDNNNDNHYQDRPVKEVSGPSENTNASSNDESSGEQGKNLMIKISLVQPNTKQPRKNFNEEELNELSESIQKYGIVEPLVVRKNGPLYEIVAGERRWRAAKLAGLDKVPVVIKEYDERTAREVALIENIQRANLNPIEEALAYQNLIEDYGLTQDEVARRVSKNRSTITNALRILNLNKEIQELIRDGKLTQGHARALLAIEDEELREKIAARVVAENLSVREIEKLVRLEGLAQFRDRKREAKNTDEMKQLYAILKDLEKKLKHKLNTKVNIVPRNQDAGKIEIEYYSKEELDNIFLAINGTIDQQQ